MSSSSLQQQLDKIRKNPEFTFGTGSGRLTNKLKPSFLFDPKVAATHDLETIYNLGRNGFAELVRIDADRFSFYEEPLFSDSAKVTDRILQDQEYNRKLDHVLNAFLESLSKYFLLKPAAKVIEWLIRRFRINEFNTEAIIACILPFYETQHFTKLMSTIDFSQCQRWTFLSTVDDSAKPIERSFFIRQLCSDASLVDFIYCFVQKQVHSHNSYSTAFTFYTATLLQYISQIEQVTDNTATMLMPYIIDGVSSSNHEWRLSNYLVLCQLAARSPLTKPALDELIKRIILRAQGSLSQAVMTLVYLAQSQPHFPTKCAALSKLFDLDDILSELEQMSVQYKCDNLWIAFVQSLASGDRYDDLLKLLEHPRISLPAASIQKLVMSILHNAAVDHKITDLVSPILRRMQGRYSEVMDRAITDFMNEGCRQASKSHQSVIFSVLDSCLGNTPHGAMPDTGTTLFLAMRHPDDSFCLLAIRQFERLLNNTDGESIQLVNEDKLHLSESIVDAMSRRDRTICNVILNSPPLFQFAAEHASALLSKYLVSRMQLEPSKSIATTLFSFYQNHQQVLTSHPETCNSVELSLRHIQVFHKEWVPSVDQAFSNPPTTQEIIQLLNVMHYALSGLHWVTSDNFESVAMHVLNLVCKESTLAIRNRALESTLAFGSNKYQQEALFAVLSLTDDLLNDSSHLLTSMTSGQSSLIHLCVGLQQPSTIVVRRCLQYINVVITNVPGVNDFQVLLLHVLPCLLSTDKAVRDTVVVVLQSILNLLSTTTGDIQAPIGGYSKSDILFAQPKVLQKWLKNVIDSDVAASNEAVLYINYRKKMSRVLDTFLSHMPHLELSLLTMWLRLLTQVNSKYVFMGLHKHFRSLHKRLIDRAADAEEVDVLVQFIAHITPSVAAQILVDDSLQTIKEFLVGYTTPSLIRVQQATLTKITPELWNSLSDMQQDQILKILLNITAKSQVSDVVIEAKSVLRQIPISVDVLVRMFRSLISTMSVDSSTNRASKRSNKGTVMHRRLGKLTSLLELVSFKDVSNSQLLMAPLFSTLQTILNHPAYNHYDYIVQLVLSDLLHVDKCGLDESVYRIDLLVNCIRSTDNPQTHNCVLLVLSALSPQCADKVLLHLMPIFTFMGAHVLRQDDEYTFNVIGSTIAKIIPSLLMNVNHVKHVIQVFADAVHHIPVHRRLRLFTTLANTLGSKYLYAIISLLLEQESVKLLEFSLLLWAEFSVPEQLDCLIQVVRLCNGEDEQQLHQNENVNKQSICGNQVTVQETGSKRPKKIRHKGGKVQANPMSSMGDDGKERLVSAETLVKLQQPLLVFIDEALMMRSFIQELSKVRVEPQVKTFIVTLLILVQGQAGMKPILRIAYRVLDKVHHLLSLITFMYVVSELWHHDNPLVQQRAMAMFVERITNLSAGTVTKYKKRLMGTLPAIIKLIDPAQCQDPELIQLSIMALQQLCIRFATRFPQQFMEYLPALLVHIVQPCTNGNSSVKDRQTPMAVTASAFVCLSHFITQLTQQTVKHFNEWMPALLVFLSGQDQSETLNRISALACLEQSVRHMHAFMSPYLCRMLSILFKIRVELVVNDPTDRDQLDVLRGKMDDILTLIPTQVHSRYMVPAIIKYTSTINGHHETHLMYFTKLVGQLVKCLDKDEIKNNYSNLFDQVYLPIFDMDPFPSTVVSAFVELVMKLNEDMFRPLFTRMIDWQRHIDGGPRRRQVFFQIVSVLYDTLKNLLVGHVAPAFDDMTESVLKVVNERGSGQLDKMEVSGAQHALTVLYKSALYDTESVTMTHAETLAQTAVRALGIQDLSLQAMRVLVQLAVSANSNDTVWKCVHQPLLAAMCVHHNGNTNDRDVLAWRKASVVTVGQIFMAVGEGYLIMLPETVPALAECLEDEDLESEAAETVRQIEAVLGEPLTKYLQK